MKSHECIIVTPQPLTDHAQASRELATLEAAIRKQGIERAASRLAFLCNEFREGLLQLGVMNTAIDEMIRALVLTDAAKQKAGDNEVRSFLLLTNYQRATEKYRDEA
jgi:hypothetical protein